MKKISLFLIAILFMASGLNAQTLIKIGEETKSITTGKRMKSGFDGYFNITDMGLMIGSTDNSRVAPFSFITTNGLHLTEQFSAGLGVGVEFPAGSYMPIVIDLRYYIRNTAFSPFLSIYGGYALPLDDDNGYYGGSTAWDTDGLDSYYEYTPYEAQGGFILNPGFGIRSLVGDDFGVIFSVGYRFQRLYYKADKDRQMIADYNRLTLKVGITFR
ncbi:MAG: hypothetical protein HN352_03275 [Bacteroidetes bacterium]|jgi:hypothetical protein|nr:hypothetical protein [Bacteroidota bacterium]MBT3749331.1 hypothetical protein [Bacteroidota bacterium]MBT4400499.1 hypothetical protein [Bacteroidota bacterium]MBT4411367.1 hypothetical protein [Bacteroidota bacterium]MBT5425160.1 hypothetical protein [Bacteroidota bacterium]